MNARLEYLYQLTDACGPYIVNHINELWADSKRRVRAFQLGDEGGERRGGGAQVHVVPCREGGCEGVWVGGWVGRRVGGWV